MIPLTTWYAHHGGAPIPHHAARPRTTTLHLEWHVAGERISHHNTLTSALLARPAGGVLMVLGVGGLVPWSERGRG